ncbi:hypothetical protein [Pontimicrobium aquaticum]|uniref:Polymer-forming cytoskeletal protein n=1 Tax=Pontimicrobium aquaticum TaxID=2565367 RepID=A0A4U0EZB5_9FLAO|nr:hypothetical protein [Pontimicrobium aquaticum]TJY37396.1 hypothetical protein E5167_05490 [Pontimicrobium aquaticum]
MRIIKLKAGALQITLFITVVIALLLTLFIVLVHVHKQFSLHTNIIKETLYNTQRGIDYTLKNEVMLNTPYNVSLNNNNVQIKRDFWGMFEKVSVKSKLKNVKIEKTALLGSNLPSNLDRNALYLKDNNKPLIVAGTTQIQGTAFLPRLGIRPGIITSKPYLGSKLIYGNRKLSNDLPPISNELQSHLKQLFSIEKIYGSDEFIEHSPSQKLQNSFNDKAKVLYSNQLIDLYDTELTGYIVVYSKTKIVVKPSSSLKDIILIAPEIIIKDNVNGRFQAFATKKITLGKNCLLSYPSAIVLQDEETPTNQESSTELNNSVAIDKGSMIKGLVMFLGKVAPNNFKPQILISENAIVKGEIYCKENLELKGAVHGSVYTNNFVATQSGSVYQNHIYNGKILADRLPKEYVGLTFENSSKEVLKWLY